jgi:ABC-type uncharacterized transport system substrate-binding protein
MIGGRYFSRRWFVTRVPLTVLAAPFAAEAQSAAAARRVGVLAQDLQPGLLETFRDALSQLGYVEGKSITLDVRNSMGHSERLARLADELLRLKVDVIVAVNTPAAKAAKKATSTVPIVIMRVADPVKAGLVSNLSRPGGNVTGLHFMPDELGAKGLQLLLETLPRISRVASLYQADNPGALLVVVETERRSAQMGLHFLRLPVRDLSELSGAFEAASRARVEALFVMDDGAMTKRRAEVLSLAARSSLPVVSIYKDFAEAGGLIAYGPDLSVVYRRAAYYVDRLLKGEDPGRLPVEQPEKFYLAVNLKTAKALGLTIPPSVLLRADQVIE